MMLLGRARGDLVVAREGLLVLQPIAGAMSVCDEEEILLMMMDGHRSLKQQIGFI